jgi:hypothetical protein
MAGICEGSSPKNEVTWWNKGKGVTQREPLTELSVSSHPDHPGQFSLDSPLEPVFRVSNNHCCQDLVGFGDLEEFLQGAPFVDSRRDEAEGAGAEPHGVSRQDAVHEVNYCVVGVRLQGNVDMEGLQCTLLVNPVYGSGSSASVH